MRRIDQETDDDKIRTSIKRFLIERFPSAKPRPMEDSTPLLENGVIDSLGVLDVVAFIESEFNTVVHDDDLVPENFGSIECIAAYVEGRLDDCS